MKLIKKIKKTTISKNCFRQESSAFYVSSSTGFSLVEMLVAVALFAAVMLIGVGALLSLIDANRKAQSLNSVMNNLNFALESMSRNMRVGTTYHCSTNNNVPPDIDSTKDCKNGGKLVGFEASSGDPDDPNDQFVYRVNGSRLEMSKTSGSANSFTSITAAEVTIEDFNFYVDGTSTSDDFQPRVVMTIKGSAGIDEKTKTEFNLETMVSQRVLDL